MNDRGSETDDAVGYRRPPRRTRFKPGQSGNPQGRPKGLKSLSQLVSRELDRRVFLTEEGRRRRVSKREVLAKQITKDALAGNAKARETVFGLDQQVVATMGQVATALMRPSDEVVKANLIRRLQAAMTGPSTQVDAALSVSESRAAPFQEGQS